LLSRVAVVCTARAGFFTFFVFGGDSFTFADLSCRLLSAVVDFELVLSFWGLLSFSGRVAVCFFFSPSDCAALPASAAGGGRWLVFAIVVVALLPSASALLLPSAALVLPALASRGLPPVVW